MATKKFKFQLQPALDKAVAEQEKAEAALRDAKRELAAAQAALETLAAAVAATRQQAADEHRQLVQPTEAPLSGLDFMQRDEFIKALNLKAEQQQQAVEKQRREVAWCQQRLDARQDDLKQAMMQVKSMERLRDKAMEEHRKVEERRLQEDIDEAGMQSHMRRKQ